MEHGGKRPGAGHPPGPTKKGRKKPITIGFSVEDVADIEWAKQVWGVDKEAEVARRLLRVGARVTRLLLEPGSDAAMHRDLSERLVGWLRLAVPGAEQK
ncbi:MAG: hypothetical protein WCS88_03935 [Patescibacteria group bacterium]|jgi:hypothetical protein